MKKLVNWIAVVALGAALIAGCGGSGGGSGGSDGAGFGTLSVSLADAPDPTITSIDITVSRVEAHIDGDWVVVSETPQSYNLLDLTDNDTILGSTVVPSGKYNQVRLFLSEATVTDSDGTHPVNIGSVNQTGIKVNVNYTIVPDEVTAVLLDFNVDKSLIKQGNGNYRLKPVLKAAVKTLSGTITGTVDDGTNVLNNVKVTAVYEAGDAYPLGTEVNGSATMTDGTFKVWALLPGTYTLNFDYLNEDGTVHLTGQKTGVVVVANENTDVGTVTLTAAP